MVASSKSTPSTDLSPDDLPPGTVVGYYTVVRKIGKGSFGATYEVTRDGQSLALKIATSTLSDLTPEERERQEQRADREVAALKSLSHPNIVKIHADDRWPDFRAGYRYLVMDLVDGLQLYEWQRQTTPSAKRIAAVFAKLADAIHAMHSLEIIHRDLKSANILVRRSDGEPIILDFGIARPRLANNLTREHVMVGTFDYLAPEYAAHFFSPAYQRGEPFPFAKALGAELHSLGYMAYEMLTGRSPFPPAADEADDDDIATFRRIIHTIPVPVAALNPRVPKALAQIVMRLLEKDPAQRPQTGLELASELRAFIDAAPPSTDAPLDLPAAPPPLPQRHKDLTPDERRGAAARPAAPAPILPSADVQLVPETPAAVPAPSAPKTPPSNALVAPVSSSAAFVEPSQVAAPAAPAAAPPARIQIPTAIREASAKLSGPRRLPSSVLLTGALLGVVVLFFAYVAISLRRPGGDNLIARVQRQEAQQHQDRAEPTPTPVTETPPAPNPLAVALPPPQQPAPVAPSAARPAQHATRPTAQPGAPAADIDKMLADTYGRPTIASDGTLTTAHPRADDPHGPAVAVAATAANPEPITGPAWLKRPQRLDRAIAQAAAPKAYGVPTGAHIRARLVGNLDSRTISSGPVEVVLVRPFVLDGASIFPSQTMLYGTATTNGDRFNVRFTRVRLPDHTEIKIAALALDIQDRKPGLPASRKIAAAPQSAGEGLGTQVARGAANVALGQVTGGTAQDIARGAGSTIVNATDNNSPASGPRDALLLDAGIDFDVFVEEPF